MCIFCGDPSHDAQTGFFADDALSAAAGGTVGGSAPSGSAIQALLAITEQATARWNFTAAIGTPVGAPGGLGNAASVTYDFATAEVPEWGVTGFQPLAATQQVGVRMAFAAWSAVARIGFTETSAQNADIRIGRAEQTSAGYAYFPSFGYTFSGATITSVTAQPLGGDILFSPRGNLLDMTPGTSGYETALHEIGHSIGLKHPFDAPVALPASTENYRYSIMSYTGASNTGVVDVTPGSGGGYSTLSYNLYPTTPMLYDIYAAQELYGSNLASHAGNDTYSWADHPRLLMTIWDGGGIDTIDASNQTYSNLINLVDGNFSSIGIRASDAQKRVELPAYAAAVPTPSYDGQANLGIAYGAMIENAIGGSAADTLDGNALANGLSGGGGNDWLNGEGGDDVLMGGSGDDTLLGGAGSDTALFGGSQGQYGFGMVGGAFFVNGPDGADRLTDVEFVQFGSAAAVAVATLLGAAPMFLVSGSYRIADLYHGPVTRLETQLLGTAAGEVAIGTSLNDFFNLLGGDDAVQAGAGDDVIDGGTGSNFLTGDAGRDDFFLDGRGLTTTWSTITDWQAGETLSVFGWTPGVSRMIWRASDGTAGYQGVTLHADLDGNGLIETSVTWTGLTQAALPTPQSLPGLLWFI